MNLWRNANGTLIVGANGNPVLCDDCPCGDVCSIAATSYLVRQTNLGSDVYTPTTVTQTTTWPWDCSSPPVTPPEGTGLCIWAGIVTGGSYAGRYVAVHGYPPAVWFVTFRSSICGISDTGTDLGQTDPPGNYTNGHTVV